MLYQLSNPQKRIYSTEMFYPKTLAGIIPIQLKFGRDSLNTVVKAMTLISSSAPDLHLRLCHHDDYDMGVAQHYVEPSTHEPTIIEFDSHEAYLSWVNIQTNTPFFPLIGSCLFQFYVCTLPDAVMVFCKIHHLIIDGFSVSLLVEHIIAATKAISNNTPYSLPQTSALKYLDVEQEYLSSNKLQEDKNFWLENLKALNIPNNLEFTSTETKMKHFPIDEKLCLRISEYLEKKKVSPFRFALAISNIYLARRYNSKDVVTTVASANRRYSPEIAQSFSMLVSSMPMRTTFNSDDKFSGILERSNDTLRQCLKHSEYPYNFLPAELRARGEEADGLGNFAVVDNPPPKYEDYEFTVHEIKGSAYALAIRPNYLSISKNSLTNFVVEYNTSLFSELEIEFIGSALIFITKQIIENDTITIDKLSIISATERSYLLENMRPRKCEYPKDKTIIDLFVEHAQASPDKTALVYMDKSYTYNKLHKLTDKLARWLIALGKPRAVGILIERSEYMTIGALGTLKSGAVYIPIDPTYPEERIEHMLSDSGASIILTQQSLMDRVKNFKGKLLDITKLESWDDMSQIDITYPSQEDLFIFLYTSGSTGKPKGCMLTHKNILNFCTFWTSEYGYTSNDKASAYASFGFDAHMYESYPILTVGGELHIIPEDMRLNMLAINNYFEKHGITFAFMTTQLGRQFATTMDNSSLRMFMTGGEKLLPLKKPRFKLVNGYGPTECTIMITNYLVDGKERDIPVGKSIANTRIYLLDEFGDLVPYGCDGEICAAGPQVSSGYLNRPDLTAEKFVPNKFESDSEYSVIYKTGDIAHYDKNGNLVFGGRADGQVKIRGYRIELGEIEQVIRDYPDTKLIDVTVAAFDDKLEGKFLCGYVVADQKVDISKLKQHISSTLPSYMVPASIIQLDSIKLTPNGKVDKRALPIPEFVSTEREFIPPKPGLETDVCDIWKNILGCSKISMDDNLFELGGTSIKAVAMLTQLQQLADVQLSVADILKSPTPRSICSLMQTQIKGDVITSVTGKYYTPTPQQKMMYVLRSTVDDPMAYNIGVAYDIRGTLDRSKLSAAIDSLVERHTSLRTYFETESNAVIADKVNYQKLFKRARIEEVEQILKNWRKEIDISKPPLFNVGIIEVNNTHHVLFFDVHHIICDGMSLNILVDELFRLYEGESLPPIALDYKDYANFVDRPDTALLINQQETYWLSKLNGELPTLELCCDFPRPPRLSSEGSTVRKRIRAIDILNTAREHKTTAFSVMLSAYMVMLMRHTIKEDIIVGVPFSGRDTADTLAMTGMFVNTLALRGKPEYTKTFSEFLSEMAQTVSEAQENQAYPFANLIAKLGIPRNASHNPLFDVLFNYITMDKIHTHNLDVKPYDKEREDIHFDLTLTVGEEGDFFNLDFSYCTKLFKRETVERMSSHYMNILSTIVNQPNIALGEIDYLSTDEKSHLMNIADGGECVCTRPFIELFELQSARTPLNVAVADHNSRLTYDELDRASSSLAAKLIAKGISKDDVVAIMLPRTLDFLVSALAIMKAGGAYLPIDAEYPEGRITHMLTDSGAKLLISLPQYKDRQTAYSGEIIPPDYSLDDDKITSTSSADSLAYMIYTSGSTGKPKGVQIEQASMGNFTTFYANLCEMTSESAATAYASFSFDASVKELFPPLTVGGSVHILHEDLRMSPEDIYTYIEKNHVDVAYFPTQVAEIMISVMKSTSCLKILSMGGEKLKNYTQRPYRLLNVYGPTENTDISTAFFVDKEYINIPIGVAMPGVTAYVLDHKLNLQPQGCIGELCVGGVQVARGYHNRPDITAERFVKNPFGDGRIYHTGDYVRLNSDGLLEFISRIDAQVKIRGFRVELGEIEDALSNFEGISSAVCEAFADDHGAKYLACYYVCSTPIDLTALKANLSKNLPSHSIPSYFIEIDNIPLTPNGKVDKKALPIPNTTGNTEYIPPVGEKEEQIALIWQNVLGLERVSVTDNFFEIGGSSLKAISAVTQLKNHFDITINMLFEHQSIRELANCVEMKSDTLGSQLASVRDFLACPTEKPEMNAIQQAKLELYRQNLTPPALDETLDIKSILLTGGTGYLGTHILNELFHKKTADIITIVRAKDDESAAKRLLETLSYYIGTQKAEEIVNSTRVHIFAGDISAEKLGVSGYDELRPDAIINSAANVHHFGHYQELYEANVQSVKNLIELAKKCSCKVLAHLSTTSVAFDEDSTDDLVFTEQDVNIGQDFKNYYAKTKLLAEIEIENARAEGLNTIIFRAGNLMLNSNTGMPQKNITENAFFNVFKAYVNIGIVSKELCRTEFTFINKAAEAICLLFDRKALCNRNFHIKNPNIFTYADMLLSLGVNVKEVTAPELVQSLIDVYEKPGFREYVEKLVTHTGLLTLEKSGKLNRVLCLDQTVATLEAIGFKWEAPTYPLLKDLLSFALQDRIAELCNSRLFGNSPSPAEQAAKASRLCVFEDSDYICTEGEASENIYIIMDGFAEASKNTVDGWSTFVGIHKPGDALLSNVILGMTPTKTIRALDTVVALEINAEFTKSLITQNPEMAFELIKLEVTHADNYEKLWINAM